MADAGRPMPEILRKFLREMVIAAVGKWNILHTSSTYRDDLYPYSP